MNVARHFLSPSQSLPSGAAAFLAGDWKSGVLDLRSRLVVVATRHAGRRLREALASLAASREAAVFPPLTVTPEFVVTHGTPGERVATLPDSLLAWSAVLREIDFESFQTVFPSPPSRNDFSWSMATAREFVRVKRQLAEGGLAMRDVGDGTGGGFVESRRWQELAELERLYRERLSEHGLRDADEAKIARARDPVLPEGIEKIVLLAVPDPLPLAAGALEILSRLVPVDVVIYAEDGRRDAFDAWGRPLPEAWEGVDTLAGSDGGIFHPCADPADQAHRAATLLASCRAPGDTAAVGVADAEVIPFLKRSLPRVCGVHAYDPDGRSTRSEELTILLANLRDLLRAPEFPACGELLRCPAFYRYLAGTEGIPSLPDLLRLWDAWGGERLPGDLDDALELARNDNRRADAVGRTLEAIREILNGLNGAPIPESLPEVLKKLHRKRRFDETRESDRRYMAVAGELMGLLDELRSSPLASPPPRGGDGVEILLVLLAEKRIEEERPETAVDLQGWLELLWEDAPYLVLTGINENRVPDTIDGDPFLPESLRRDLGLKNNENRLARDRYLMDALLRARRRNGRVELLFGKASESGDPLRPSRLLMQCSREELPGRLDDLFAEPPAPPVKPPWTSPWKFVPRSAVPPERIGVTQFGRYLKCPFRFYLSDVLGMETVDPRKTELDDGEFGDICHRILEAFGKDQRYKDSDDPDEIRAFFERELDRLFLTRYGRNLSVPLAIQKDSAAARLGRLAAVQAEERRTGWVIEEVEWRFSEEEPVALGGMPLRGVVDRIERNERTGEYRILDYKTSDKDKTPEDDHFATLKKGESPEDYPDYALVPGGGKPRRWTGLQLPLYRWALRGRYGDEVQCGYFNLPKAVSETGIRLWEDGSSELADAAIRCAEGVVADIRRGRFWPPAPSVPWDDFKDLFFGSPREQVDASALIPHNESGHDDRSRNSPPCDPE